APSPLHKLRRATAGLPADLPRPPRPARSEPPLPVPAPDAGRVLVFAMLLFALATWILIMAWMSRYSHMGGQYPSWPPPPLFSLDGHLVFGLAGCVTVCTSRD